MASFQALRVCGGAGTGKTTQAVDILCKAMQRPEVAGNPYALGLSSFTRAARTAAATRNGFTASGRRMAGPRSVYGSGGRKPA